MSFALLVCISALSGLVWIFVVVALSRKWLLDDPKPWL